MIPQYLVPSTPCDYYRRCFSQFDRKTDCFDDSANENLQGHSYLWAARAKPSEGALKLGSMLELDDRVINGPRGFESRAALLVERSLRDLKRGVSTRLSSCRIIKAVCGTQTRHGGSVNKNQLDSQSVLIAGSGDVADSAGEFKRYKQARTGLKRPSPAFKALWQKPGIGVAASSPVPLRGSDEEKETSTRAIGSDEGKAIAIPKRR